MSNLKNSVLKIIVAILIGIVLLVPVNSNADNTVQVITPGTPTPSATSSPAIKTSPSPEVTTSPKVTTTPTTPSKLPQTGIEDYTGLIVVTIALGASAIYAYIKIKEYNKF